MPNMNNSELEIVFQDFIRNGDYKGANELREKAKENGYEIESYNRLMQEDQIGDDWDLIEREVEQANDDRFFK